MARATDDVKNWMNMFRWIVKLIRDEYDIDEALLVRSAQLEGDLGITIEQLEQILDIIAESFSIRFPERILDEVLRLEELCMLASWIKGFYKLPEFISEAFAQNCRAANPGLA